MNKNCKQIQEKLPEYLSDVLKDKDRNEIEEHLFQCQICQNEFNELKKEVLTTEKESVACEQNYSKYHMSPPNITNEENIKKLLAKTRKKYLFKTALIVLSMLFIIVASYGCIEWGIRAIKHNASYFNGFSTDTITTALLPYDAQGLHVEGKWLSDHHSVDIYMKFGLKQEKIDTIKFEENVLNNKLIISSMEYPNYLFMKTYLSNHDSKIIDMINIDKNHFSSKNPKENSIEKNKKILEKNIDNTIVLLDLVFNEDKDLDFIKKLYEKYDVLITWAALENCGEISEDSFLYSPKYFGFELDIPENRNFSPYVEGYKNDLESFIKKSDKFKNPLLNQINSTYKQALDKDLKNIKGIRITGTTSEIYKLIEDIKPSDTSIIKMDFWNWR